MMQGMEPSEGLSALQAALKRGFDLFGSIGGLSLTWWLILLAWVAVTIDTRRNGFFIQERVGDPVFRHRYASKSAKAVPNWSIPIPVTAISCGLSSIVDAWRARRSSIEEFNR